MNLTLLALAVNCKQVDLKAGGGAMATDIVLCSWKEHLTLTVVLSTLVYRPELGDNAVMD